MSNVKPSTVAPTSWSDKRYVYRVACNSNLPNETDELTCSQIYIQPIVSKSQATLC